MRIVSWNINGIRTLESISSTVKGFGADIVCFQETKISRSNLDNNIAKIPGFYSFFNFSKVKEGYSGVATYVRESACPYKTDNQFFEASDNPEDLTGDAEGRIMITYHNLSEGNLAVINLYCPCAYIEDSEETERFKYQVKFYETLQRKVKHIIQRHHLSHVIVTGDLNVKLHPIDSAEASEMSDTAEWYTNPSRIWFKKFLQEDMIDTFRFLHPNKKESFSCWNTKLAARVNNFGTRIDYVLVDKKLENMIISSDILSDVLGSDHCPVQSEIDLKIVKSSVVPPDCTCFYPELKGKQQSIQLFTKRKLEDDDIWPFQTPQSLPKKCKTQKTLKQTSLSFFKQKCSSNCDDFHKHVQCTSSSTNVSDTTSVKTEALSSKISPKNTNNPANQNNKVSLKSVLTGLPKAPLCSGHQLPSVIRTVKKEGPNKDKMFYCCQLPIGSSKSANARCNFFRWK